MQPLLGLDGVMLQTLHTADKTRVAGLLDSFWAIRPTPKIQALCRDRNMRELSCMRIISKVATLAAIAYKTSIGALALPCRSWGMLLWGLPCAWLRAAC